MNDQIAQAFSLLSENQKQDILREIIARLELQGGGSKFENQFISGYGYGGRAGSSIPVGEGDLSFGITGESQSVNTPFGKFSERGITGGDVGYSWGPNELRATYQKRGMSGNELGEIPVEDIYRLIYSRKF